jgi:hypothetical protein
VREGWEMDQIGKWAVSGIAAGYALISGVVFYMFGKTWAIVIMILLAVAVAVYWFVHYVLETDGSSRRLTKGIERSRARGLEPKRRWSNGKVGWTVDAMGARVIQPGIPHMSHHELQYLGGEPTFLQRPPQSEPGEDPRDEQ